MNTQFLEQVSKLSVTERIGLVEAIWDTVHDAPNDIPLTPEQITLLEDRLAAYEANPTAGSSWNEVRSRLEQLG